MRVCVTCVSLLLKCVQLWVCIRVSYVHASVSRSNILVYVCVRVKAHDLCHTNNELPVKLPALGSILCHTNNYRVVHVCQTGKWKGSYPRLQCHANGKPSKHWGVETNVPYTCKTPKFKLELKFKCLADEFRQSCKKTSTTQLSSLSHDSCNCAF